MVNSLYTLRDNFNTVQQEMRDHYRYFTVDPLTDRLSLGINKDIRLDEVFVRARREIENYFARPPVLRDNQRDEQALENLSDAGRAIFRNYTDKSASWSRRLLKTIARLTPQFLKRFLPACFSNRLAQAELFTDAAYNNFVNTLGSKRAELIQRNYLPTEPINDSSSAPLPIPSAPVSVKVEVPKSVKKEEEEAIEQAHTCPISLELFTHPYILLEEGFSYEKEAINHWFSNHDHDKSPVTGTRLWNPTLCENKALRKSGAEIYKCPLTGAMMKEPYYCREDGYTYEREDIMNWYKEQLRTKPRGAKIYSPGVPHGEPGIELRALTLYPNKVLFRNGGIPISQDPIRL